MADYSKYLTWDFLTSPAMKMYLGDVLFQKGTTEGIPDDYITSEMREWMRDRSLQYKNMIEAGSGQPVTTIYPSKKDRFSGMMGGFYTDDPNYSDPTSPAWQLRHIIGDTNVNFIPESNGMFRQVTRNEGYDWSPDYYISNIQDNLANVIEGMWYNLTGSDQPIGGIELGGVIGHTFGTKEAFNKQQEQAAQKFGSRVMLPDGTPTPFIKHPIHGGLVYQPGPGIGKGAVKKDIEW